MNNLVNYPVMAVDDIVRPTQLLIDLRILKENYLKIKSHVFPSKVMPILKANAYGHGLVRVGQLMEELKADYIGVAVLEEGILLRESGVTIPILVLGGIWGNQIPVFIKYDLAMTASSIEKLQQIDEISDKLKKKAKVHLKIDTGMERIGVHYYSADKLLEESLKYKSIIVEGIYTHLANSENRDLSYTRLQLDRFNEVLRFYDRHSIELPIRHISNSGAICQMPEANFDMVRPGIMLYGIYPSTETYPTLEVLPVLQWKSLVVYFKVIKPNHPVGYGSKWQSDHNVRAVTIPVGYGDGYLRSMSSSAEVIIRDKLYPVIGSISMDQIVINIEQDSAFNGDEVILIGKSDNVEIKVEDLANWAGTIPYEILTNINTRVPRIYIE
ncbi:MAG: alanine racemase [Melioribacteraceae bacterium]|nr:alanine racemase [Melioribacteraceae bacterium]